MTTTGQFLSPGDAARRLGVSAKALRLYEQRGLVSPVRTAAGWRTYGPTQLAQAREIVALRAIGLSLTQVAQVMDGDAKSLQPALAAHQAALEARLRALSQAVAKVAGLRIDLANGKPLAAGDLAQLLQAPPTTTVAFDLPWPWGGERFELFDLPSLTYIIGPLGSGKTRLGKHLAQSITGAAFLGLERVEQDVLAQQRELDADPPSRSRLDQTLAWLAEDGATMSDALTALVIGLETPGPDVLVVDVVEHGLDHATQEALIAYLRQCSAGSRPLFLLTRSSAILDLAAIGPDEAIILCPANHSPPTRVHPYPGAPGYEAVATCLATPEVRARTEGVIAWRPPSPEQKRSASDPLTNRHPPQ